MEIGVKFIQIHVFLLYMSPQTEFGSGPFKNVAIGMRRLGRGASHVATMWFPKTSTNIFFSADRSAFPTVR